MMPYGWHDGAWGYVMMIGSLALFVLHVYLVMRSATVSDRQDRAPRRVDALLTLINGSRAAR